jgi:uncharacterized protein (DUF427 family)
MLAQILAFIGPTIAWLWCAKSVSCTIVYTFRFMEEKTKTIQAKWNGELIAESDKTIHIEGNRYFPPEAVNNEFLKASDTHTTCAWKGEASYYHVEVNGELNKDAAWYYPDPRPMAEGFKNYIAFWNGVEVKEV